jgi:hypothetical protein
VDQVYANIVNPFYGKAVVLIKDAMESSIPFGITRLYFVLPKSNFNSLANQLGIHLILAKREKLSSNCLANQLGKNRNLQNSPPHTHICARIVLPSAFPSRWEGEKRNKE